MLYLFWIQCQLWHTGEGVGCDWDLETIKFSLKDNDSSAYNFTFKECIKEGKVYERTIDQQEQKPYTVKVRVRIKIGDFLSKNSDKYIHKIMIKLLFLNASSSCYLKCFKRRNWWIGQSHNIWRQRWYQTPKTQDLKRKLG